MAATSTGPTGPTRKCVECSATGAAKCGERAPSGLEDGLSRSPELHIFQPGDGSMSKENADPATLSFEDSLAELEKIVAQLERGDVPLADSIRIYKRGAALKARCESQLKDAQLEVDQIVMGPDGPRTEPAKIGQ